ncbi:hypothetical protein QBC43DRAFT_370831 [Cladorrhinum sp. PSN259]|nr:hypothetical protein QBC43DRAFT_370831 [Cladorrhinum sp. PSN259]
MTTLVPPTFTLADVEKHSKPDDLWLIINNKVYDVTKYLEDHPGGVAVLTEVGGADATQAFAEVGHSAEADDELKLLFVGNLAEEEHVETLEVFRPTYLDVGQEAAVKVTLKKSKNKRSRALPSLAVALTLGAGAAAWAGNAPLFVGGPSDLIVRLIRQPCALAIKYLPTSLTSGSGGRSMFWWGIGLATIAEVTGTLALSAWAWSKLDVQEEFTHYPAHRKASPSQHVPILNVPTVSGSYRAAIAPKAIPVIDPQQWRKFKLVRKTLVSPNVYRIVFALPKPYSVLGLPTGQHIALRAIIDGKPVARSYTPVSNNSDLGRIELLIKVYDKGALTKHLETMSIGDTIDIRGPKGSMQYKPNSYAKKIGMIAGGTGITPMFQMIRAICEDESDNTTMSLLYASNSEADILLREELDGFAALCPHKFQVRHVLAHPKGEWTGLSGFVNAEMIKEYLPAASDDTKMLLCGPPPMVNAMTKNLVSLGFKQPGAMSKANDQVFLF